MSLSLGPRHVFGFYPVTVIDKSRRNTQVRRACEHLHAHGSSLTSGVWRWRNIAALTEEDGLGSLEEEAVMADVFQDRSS